MFGMDPTQIPLFAMLRQRLGYLSERQKLISENVANSDTPGYQPKDLKPFSFDATLQSLAGSGASGAAGGAGGPVMTQPGHMGLPGGAGGAAQARFRTVTARDSETTLDGNSVVLEDEMMKMSDARTNYDAAISFYQKSLSLLRTAARAPGK